MRHGCATTMPKGLTACWLLSRIVSYWVVRSAVYIVNTQLFDILWRQVSICTHGLAARVLEQNSTWRYSKFSHKKTYIVSLWASHRRILLPLLFISDLGFEP